MSTAPGRLESVVVVGASLAGVHAAATLRSAGFGGPLAVVDAQPHRPYDRPPLSKQALRGEWDDDRLGLAAARDLDVDWHLGSPAVGLAAGPPHRVTLADGTELEADAVVIATGADARHLPGTEGMVGVLALRTLDDCHTVRRAVEAGARRVLVVGAGFIGGEVAASCREQGLDVVMVEAAPVPLERAVGRRVGELVADLHREHGVDVRLGTGIDHLVAADDGRLTGAVLAGGEELDVDLAVVGIGVAPAVGWLAGAGLTLDDGVVCDEALRAGPGIVAAGDLARYRSTRYGGLVRVEHWEHAIAAGEAAARTLLADAAGTPAEPFDPLPFFWSDQYDRKLQLAGRTGADDHVELVHGSFEERRFVVLYGREGRTTAVLGMNRPRHVMQLRHLADTQAPFDDAVATARAL